MRTELEDYVVRDGQARMRNKLVDILGFVIRGLKCSTQTVCGDENNETIRNYHEGKAQAYRELLTFFECYLRKDKEN